MSERPRKSFSAAAAAAAAEARKSFSASVDLTKIVPKQQQQQQQKLQQQGNAARVENSTEKESAVDARGQDQERSPASPLPKQLLMPVLPVATVDAIMSASDVRSDNANLGPYLVKLAKSFAAGENPAKALEYGKRAVSFYEKYMDTDGNTCLDLVVSLHILAALHCRLGQYEEGVPLLERSVQLPDVAKGGEEHALAKFAGHMQLGDTLNLMGKQASALESYHAALALQKNMLGDLDPRVGETCHYIAEAHLQVR
jgi:tetratricopeptide (TPR) repeat protein